MVTQTDDEPVQIVISDRTLNFWWVQLRRRSGTNRTLWCHKEGFRLREGRANQNPASLIIDLWADGLTAEEDVTHRTQWPAMVACLTRIINQGFWTCNLWHTSLDPHTLVCCPHTSHLFRSAHASLSPLFPCQYISSHMNACINGGDFIHDCAAGSYLVISLIRSIHLSFPISRCPHRQTGTWCTQAGSSHLNLGQIRSRLSWIFWDRIKQGYRHARSHRRNVNYSAVTPISLGTSERGPFYLEEASVNSCQLIVSTGLSILNRTFEQNITTNWQLQKTKAA